MRPPALACRGVQSPQVPQPEHGDKLWVVVQAGVLLKPTKTAPNLGRCLHVQVTQRGAREAKVCPQEGGRTP